MWVILRDGISPKINFALLCGPGDWEAIDKETQIYTNTPVVIRNHKKSKNWSVSSQYGSKLADNCQFAIEIFMKTLWSNLSKIAIQFF
jgi:hypothetical protein